MNPQYFNNATQQKQMYILYNALNHKILRVLIERTNALYKVKLFYYPASHIYNEPAFYVTVWFTLNRKPVKLFASYTIRSLNGFLKNISIDSLNVQT